MEEILSALPAVIEKNNIKLTEYNDPTYGYQDKIFLQCTCVGFYLTQKDLKDLYTVVSYYLNADEYADINLTIGGDHVAI